MIFVLVDNIEREIIFLIFKIKIVSVFILNYITQKFRIIGLLKYIAEKRYSVYIYYTHLILNC